MFRIRWPIEKIFHLLWQGKGALKPDDQKAQVFKGLRRMPMPFAENSGKK
jgi:hypothetical protein